MVESLPEKGLAAKLKRLLGYREVSVFFILLLEIFIFFLIIDVWFNYGGEKKIFLNLDTFYLILRYSSFYAIAAVGAAMIIISNGIDLSPGSVMALTAVVTGSCYIKLEWPLLPSCAMGILVGAACGALASFMIVEIKLPARVQKALPPRLSAGLEEFLGIQLPPFIATLGIMGVARGLAFIMMKGETFIDLSARLPRDKVVMDYTFPDVLVACSILLMFAIAIGFHWFMVRTRWGRQIHAVGGNETAAAFSGVKVGRMKAIVYLTGAVLASVSGLILAVAEGQAQQNMALGYELDIIAAAVVGGASLSGGRGSVLGAVIGSLIFGVLRTGLNQITGAAYYERFIVGLAVVVIVIIDQYTARRQARIS